MVTLAAGLVLVLVFAVAGAAKLADRGGTRTAVAAFGVPRPLIAAAALLVPLAEITAAVLLLVPGARVAGAAAVLALLGMLSGAVAISMARGRAPDCHCFGQLHSRPAGWTTLARNAGLGGLAVLALTGDPVAPGATAILTCAAAVATAGTATAIALGFLSLIRSHGRLLLRIDALEHALAEAGVAVAEATPAPPQIGMAPGSNAPSFAAIDHTGAAISLDDLLAPGLPLLLTFTSLECDPCRELMPRLEAWRGEHADRMTIAVVSTGDRAAAAEEARLHGFDRVIVDEDFGLYERYEANGTPSAVLVSPDATVASFVAGGADAVERLVDDVLAAPEPIRGLAPGAVVPDLDLRGLDREPVALVDGERTSLVLFWNPQCGFCGSMLDDVLAWERGAPGDAPRLVVVSSGDAEATRADGFKSPVAHDPEMLAGETFGAAGTPMAVLVDRDGRVASPLAAGAAAVLALAGPQAARSGRRAT